MVFASRNVVTFDLNSVDLATLSSYTSRASYVPRSVRLLVVEYTAPWPEDGASTTL